MKQLAPCYVLPWTTVPCQGMTASMASSKAQMVVCSASVSIVSSLPSLCVEPKGLLMHVKQIWQPLGFDSHTDMFIIITAYSHPWSLCKAPEDHQNDPVSSPIATHASAFEWLLCPWSDDLSLNSFRWLLSWLGKILLPAMPDGIREGWFWLWSVWVQHPHDQVPTFNLH